MNYNYIILGDTTCDLTEEIRNKYNIEYIHSHIIYPDGKDRIATLNWEDYEYFGKNCAKDFFYNELKKNPEAFKTSPANIEEISEIFKNYASKGLGIIYIAISSGMSGAYNFALKARQLVLQEIPDAKINCVDSLRFGSGIGLMLVHAAILRNEGKSFEEVSAYLEENKCRFHQMGWLDDLSFVAKKGRVTQTKALLGTLAGIKTIGEFDYNGFTTPIGYAKGEKSAFEAMLGYIEKTIENPKDQIIFISESNRASKAEIYKKVIEEKFHPKEIIINTVFPPCGINVGPGLLAAYYVGKPINRGLVEEKSIIESFLNKRDCKNRIKKIDGSLFENMVWCGLQNLKCHEEKINRINVFPVSDGDTGTNMRFTLEKGIVSSKSSEKLCEYLKHLSKGMLLGARGNSGVILSQIFKGIYSYLKDKKCASVKDFAQALYMGSKFVYEAVVTPVEGTILTVTSNGILSVLPKVSLSTDLLSFFDIYITALNEVLKKTPEYLPVLKTEGVVDSGAAGYIKIIEGMKNYLIDKDKANVADDCADCGTECKDDCNIDCNCEEKCEILDCDAFTKDSDFTLGYCLEFVLQLLDSKCCASNINMEDMIEELESMGESLIAIKDNTILKIHIHVKNPVPVISYVLRFGEFVSFKLENMQLQHNQMCMED